MCEVSCVSVRYRPLYITLHSLYVPSSSLHVWLAGAEVATSLPLQMAVYFNVVYAPLWMVSSVLALQTKVQGTDHHMTSLQANIGNMCLWIVVLRVYLYTTLDTLLQHKSPPNHKHLCMLNMLLPMHYRQLT